MNDKTSYFDEHSNQPDNYHKATMYTDLVQRDFQVAIMELKQEGLVFSRNVRCTIFFIITITNLIINMDHGTIPSATSEIKRDLDIDDGSLGIFGSLVYLGNIIGNYSFLIRGFNFYERHERHQSKMGDYF
jgi:hypothetical protein